MRKRAAILSADVVRTGPARRRHRALKWSAAAGVAVAAAALAVFATWLQVGRPPATATDPAATAQTPAMAVLPFRASAETGEARALAAGLRQDIVDALAAAAPFPVLAAEAPPEEVPAELAGSLGVRYLVSGGIDASSGRPRVTARLFDAAAGREVWTKSYAPATVDGAELDATVARDLAAALDLPEPVTTPSEPRPGPPARLPRPATEGGP